MEKNLQRMIQLADESFGMHQDPAQLSVDEAVRARLLRLHPQTMGEARDEDGPIAWTLVIPTTRSLMEAFLAEKITEMELFKLTPEGATFDAVYLCSALVLPEHRQQGVSKRLLCDSLRSICAEHPIKELFYWTFSGAGERLAESIAAEFGLPIRCRPR